MKIIKCNRCGKDIPQYSPMANMATVDIYPIVNMTVMYHQCFAPMVEIDLCKECSKAVVEFANPAQKVDTKSCI